MARVMSITKATPEFWPSYHSLNAVVPSLLIAALGLVFLAWQMLIAPAPLPSGKDEGATAAQLGVIFAPWSPRGMAGAAQLGLPIIALRWGGYLAVVDVSAQPSAKAALQSAGYFVINTATPPTCFVQKDPLNV